MKKFGEMLFAIQKYYCPAVPIIKSAKNICRNCCFFDLKFVKK